MHDLIFGLLLGWGAAVPIGPINLEIIRRNLNLGARYGLAFGCGASCADITYIALFSFGLMAFLTHTAVLHGVSIVGALILLWFAYQAWTTEKPKPSGQVTVQKSLSPNSPLKKHFLESYLMTLCNPMTIVFWGSLGAQVASLAQKGTAHSMLVVFGVFLGTFSWFTGLNGVLHFTRHRLSDRVMHGLNALGAILLGLYGLFFLFHAFL